MPFYKYHTLHHKQLSQLFDTVLLCWDYQIFHLFLGPPRHRDLRSRADKDGTGRHPGDLPQRI